MYKPKSELLARILTVHYILRHTTALRLYTESLFPQKAEY